MHDKTKFKTLQISQREVNDFLVLGKFLDRKLIASWTEKFFLSSWHKRKSRLEPVPAWGGDWKMDGQIDGQTNKSPAVFYRISSHWDIHQCKTGQRVSLTTYCPWATCLYIFITKEISITFKKIKIMTWDTYTYYTNAGVQLKYYGTD